jgi:hypothetical protein
VRRRRDAIRQTFQVMVPFRRAVRQASPGRGERFGFRATDCPGEWTVHFDGDEPRLDDKLGPCTVEFLGTASDLMLFLWGRIPADRLADVRGNRDATVRYFALVPPV